MIDAAEVKLDDLGTDHLMGTLKKRCSVMQGTQKRVLLLGPPGCGKGTQSQWLAEEYGLVHLATGDILRTAIANGTEVGRMAKGIMSAGQLVPDDIILNLMKERLEELNKLPNFKGYILDGFPRTVAQAQGLDEILAESKTSLNAVINLVVDDETLTRRVCGRRIHLASGRLYHVEFKPPKKAGFDDITGEPLTHRPDDNSEALKCRLEVYREQTAPLVDYYQQKGLLFRVDAVQSQAAVSQDIQLLFALANPAEGGPMSRSLMTTTTS